MRGNNIPRKPGDQWPFGPVGPAVSEWRVLVFFAESEAATGGDHDRARAEFWSSASQRLDSLGFALDTCEDEEMRESGGRPEPAGPWASFLPRHDASGPRSARVRVRAVDVPSPSPPGVIPGDAAEPVPLGVVIGGGPRDAVTAAAVVSALQGLGIPCVQAESIDGAAEALIARMLPRLPGGADHGVSHAPWATGPAPSTSASPWRKGLLAPLVGLLVLHSVNPWLRGEFKTRFQLPGFSYDFLNFESVPLVAPLVVGLPTLVAYLVIGRLWHWTKVAPPRWACWAMFIPAATTAYFAARFFIEGRIVSTHSQVVHSEGLGMLVETIGMFEPVADDHFRYVQPAGVNYSHTIQPFWEPWAIFLVALGVGVLAVRSIYSLRRNTEP